MFKIKSIHLLPILVLLALTLIFFHRLAFTDLILARGDTFAYFYPYWAVRNAALIQGHLPLWTPNLFMGAPLLANSQLGTFYPLNWPLIALSPPDGIRVSILLHIFWALLGAYVLARIPSPKSLSSIAGLPSVAHFVERGLSENTSTTKVERWSGIKESIPALVAAAVFGLGGYAGAHVEQINQLQGIAWMSWLFLFYARALDGSQRTLWVLLLGAGLALQFLSGHTQTVFITGVGLGIYGIVHGISSHHKQRLRRIVTAVLVLVVAGLITLPLIVPQLIPTMELTRVSNRSGGLNPNQATAFSFNPFVIGRGLMPSYDSLVFGEYVAYAGVIGFGLVIVGIFATGRARWVWLAVMLGGLALAFGEFNPLYWTLAGLPGFNLFRVPARWLALFALGAAMLAGIGLQSLAEKRPNWRILVLIVVVIAALAASSTLITRTPEDVIGSAAPTTVTWVGWGAALVVFVGLVVTKERTRRASSLQTILAVAVIIELFFASGVMPYNMLSTPDTYHSQRFTISQMRTYAAEQTPPGRVLSITDLLFDPGDRAALEARYQRYGLSDLSIRLGLVDTKMKESLAANLPLIWDIPSVDGFDGGVLPTSYYTAFTSLMIPQGELRTLDGRLREIMAQEECRGACIPDQRWLNLTNTRYLLTDKIYDLWHDDIAYDTQFTVTDSTRINFEPFEADTVDLLVRCVDCDCPAPDSTPTQAGDFLRCRVSLDEAVELNTFEITASDTTPVQALTFVDARTGDFVQVVPDSNWKRVLSSDIKLYENQAVLPRAFVVQEALVVTDDIYGTEDALNLMRDVNFDPAKTVVLSSDIERSMHEPSNATAAITEYTAERVEIGVNAESGAYLVLTDAYYPGWAATINGQPAEIIRANVMFRAVQIPAGESTVTFAYQPGWMPGALIVGAVAWLILIIVIVYASAFTRYQ